MGQEITKLKPRAKLKFQDSGFAHDVSRDANRAKVEADAPTSGEPKKTMKDAAGGAVIRVSGGTPASTMGSLMIEALIAVRVRCRRRLQGLRPLIA